MNSVPVEVAFISSEYLFSPFNSNVSVGVGCSSCLLRLFLSILLSILSMAFFVDKGIPLDWSKRGEEGEESIGSIEGLMVFICEVGFALVK